MTNHFGEPHKMVPVAFDALLRRATRPGRYCPRVARVLSTPAPWDGGEVERTPNQLQTCPKLDTAMINPTLEAAND